MTGAPAAKRARLGNEEGTKSGALTVHQSSSSGSRALIKAGGKAPPRTSSLTAPIVQLKGHSGAIYASKFNEDGTLIASASRDKSILLWSLLPRKECVNFLSLEGHTHSVVDLAWANDGVRLFSASADKNGASWDVETGERLKRFRGHSSFLNAICVAPQSSADIIATVADDSSARLWDGRGRASYANIALRYPALAVAFDRNGSQLFTAGVENSIRVWDVRKTDAEVYRLMGHSDTITGLSLSPDGTHLLSNSMDNTLRQWDIRPYAPADRCVNVFRGHRHGVEKELLRCSWSPDGERIAAGSSNRFVYVWDTDSGRVEYQLPGHVGSVNQVEFHPSEPVIVSCSNDKTMFVGELKHT